ncbi:MAG: IS30 family transposase [Chitinophagales bacterium]|nr:IS30 family transposase [Chitinophagales bacterium]HMW39162.1 IS30 family transposase [Saprospiraceae bacterium]HNH67204.1 IS30 family transposase [Bacteroidia bacterium]HMY43743.1 IS30 family transposase [Chitinophagales bacterium]HMZ95263.1 IS30 family transposase [Chitinophagales bacterium]
MTKKYQQLNLAQRYKIEAYVAIGKTQTAIADLLGVHKSTISRELRRNVPKRGIGAKEYVAVKAQCKTEKRHIEKHKHTRFTDKLKQQMKKMLTEKKYSPELVEAQWQKDNIKGVSHETMYQFIWLCKHTNQRKNKEYKALYKHLKHGKRRRKRYNYKDSRGLIPNRISIDKRPKIVEKRKRFGDVEVDLIMGKNHQSALLVIVDRASLLTRMEKLKGKNATIIARKIIKKIQILPPLKTMTFDNDQAFAHHEIIARACNVKTYFTRPYTSQDKGTIENRNGVIRQFFPKKTDFNLISYKEIKRVENEINNRPIRKFNYLTPNEVFLQFTG